MIYNFGSINIDHIYRVPHLPQPGETLAAGSYSQHLGGKGINQSIAIAKAGGDVVHIGAVGPDGDWALERIQEAGVATDAIERSNTHTGHAVINVDNNGENAIVIFSGANAELTNQQLQQTLAHATVKDWILLQNETNLIEEIATKSKGHGCKVVYSAAPFVAETAMSILHKIDLLVVNQIEASALAELLGVPLDRIPVPQLLVTLGKDGAFFRDASRVTEQKAFEVEPVDSTGAGDTFLGSFLARFCEVNEPAAALRYASAASALQVTRHGAATAIPSRDEVDEFLNLRGG